MVCASMELYFYFYGFMKSRIVYVWLAALLLFAATLSGCVKGNDAVEFPRSYLMFWNAYSGADSVIFNINDQDVLTGYVERDTNSKYNQIYSGDISLGVRVNGSENNLLKESQSLAGGKYYSCFFAGDSQGADLLKVEDDLSAPDSLSNAKLRFITLARGEVPLNFSVRAGTNLFANQEYLKASAFNMIPADTLMLRVYRSSAPAVALDSLRIISAARAIYTATVSKRSDGRLKLAVRRQ